jgi:XrtJ-associated TM-motif-TM protein
MPVFVDFTLHQTLKWEYFPRFAPLTGFLLRESGPNALKACTEIKRERAQRASDENKGSYFMKKSLLLIALAFAVTALPARAQTGCDDSPENPTLILAGLAGGAFAISSVRTRLRARRFTKK